ncbi:MAG TPA: hypothetical protein PKI03_22400, partial [Pseudomonadota bacterium]|nr:hypothetical protein [Pseudomonadota bacterium]
TPLLANGHALRARKALPLVSLGLLAGSVGLLAWRGYLNGNPAEGDCHDPAGRVILDNCEWRTWRSITGTATAAGVSAVGMSLGFIFWPREPSAAAAEGKK